MMFGATTTTNVRIKIKKNNLLFKKIFLICLSNNKKTIEIIKYIAAYFAKNAKPTNAPSKTKFKIFGFSLIINICNSAKDQNSISKISVETKKEETETAGIRKKDVAVKRAKL